MSTVSIRSLGVIANLLLSNFGIVVSRGLLCFGTLRNHPVDSGDELDIVIMSLADPSGEPDKADAVDGPHPQVNEFVREVVAGVVIGIAIALLNIDDGGMPFDLPGSLVDGTSLVDGAPRYFP